MFSGVWNRLTKFAILGLVLAIIGIVLGYTSQLDQGLAQYLAVFAIILFITRISIEGYGVYEARHFFEKMHGKCIGE